MNIATFQCSLENKTQQHFFRFFEILWDSFGDDRGRRGREGIILWLLWRIQRSIDVVSVGTREHKRERRDRRGLLKGESTVKVIGRSSLRPTLRAAMTSPAPRPKCGKRKCGKRNCGKGGSNCCHFLAFVWLFEVGHLATTSSPFRISRIPNVTYGT